MGAIAEFRIGPQKGPQSSLLSCPANEVFYGGARGGGKSFGILLDWYKHQSKYGDKARGILFRRTMPELEDILEKAKSIYPLFGAEYKEQKRIWYFPGGATLKFRYLDRDSDADNYQGHEYNWQGFDESGNWPHPEPIDKLRACFRSAHGVKHRMILTGNPGGPGHNWLKARFIDPVPPKTIQRLKDFDDIWYRTFIPAKVQDNKILLANDPGYMARLKQAGPDWLVKAWLEGDWNIVAGGMFDDVWRNEVHIIHPFRIPQSWRIDRSFDWGSSRPFSVGWWAESDGTEVKLSDGSRKAWPRGTLFRIAEWYGWSGKPNEGCRMLATEIARGILDREKSMGIKVRPGPADSSIFDVQNGNCIADDMARIGVRWEKADKSPGSRVNGWEHMRQMLKAATVHPMEEPGLFVFETCRQFIRTIPALPRDDKKPDDVDSSSEDHCFTGDTLVDTVNGQIRIADLVGRSGYIYTDSGIKEFTNCRLTREKAEIVTVTFTDGRKVNCTPDHKFLTISKQWVEAKDLTDEICYSMTFKERVICKFQSLAIQFRNLMASVFTDAGSTFSTKDADCIGLYGNTTLVKFPKDIMSTTKTMIDQTINPIILSYCLLQSTLRSTEKIEKLLLLMRREKQQRNGMDQNKGGIGIKSNISGIARPHCKGKLSRNVYSAGLNIKQQKGNFARTIASQLIGGRQESTTYNELASIVEKILRSTVTGLSRPVGESAEVVCVHPAGKDDVYCLTVPDANKFSIAGGIIVHNCGDESRYRCAKIHRTATQTRIKGLY